MASALRRLKHSVSNFAIIILAFASVVLLSLEVIFQLNPSQQTIVNTLDVIICALFLYDFLNHYQHSPNKNTFFKTHWWELIAVVPLVTPIIHVLNLVPLPLLAIVRLIRLGVRLRLIVLASFHYTKNPYLIYIVTLVAVVIFAGAGGFYYFENGPNPNVHSYWDGVWWALVTTATIGYGDIFPVTTGGRTVAVIVMFVGIALLGTFIATIESLLVSKSFKSVSEKKLSPKKPKRK